MTGEHVSIGVRRVSGLDLAAPLPDSDPALVARIQAEIRTNGPMPFARFMDLALYDPESGYYSAAPAPDASAGRGPGREGDFLTAPEGHPIFGWAMARHLEAVWHRLDRPDPFVVREHGAGAGGLALGVLDGLRRSSSALAEAIRYQVVEISEARVDHVHTRLAAAGLAERLEPADSRPAAGAVVANELLDAMPVHVVEGAARDDARGPLLERFVGLRPDGSFAWMLGPASTPALGHRLVAEGISLVPGQRAEICLAIDGWLAAAPAQLERGVVLVVDYGAPATELYTPERGSTLRAYQRHRVHADPFVAVGRQDLTAHVDFTAVGRAGVAAGLQPLGRTTQAAFLASLGLGELLVALQSGPDASLERYVDARSAVARMLDPRATGGFGVLAFGRGVAPEPELRGFDPAPVPAGARPDPNR